MLAYSAAFLCASFGIFFWLIFGSDVIWNDYPVYQLRYSQIYRFYLRLDLEPLWYPHMELGMPFGGLVMSQAFHLPAWLMEKIPAYWNGSALTLFSAKHILLCALSQGAIYFALRQFAGLSALLSFALSFLFVFQLRTLDAIRYGTFNDAFAYFLVAAVSGLAYLRNGSVAAAVLLACATQLMLTAGYQPILTYGLVGVLLSAPILMSVVLKGYPWPRRLPWAILAVIAGFLFSAPHWLPFVDFLNLNAQRVSQTDIQWANSYAIVTPNPFPHNLTGYFANLVTPWFSEVHSAFGGSGLYSIVILSLAIYLLRTIRRNYLILGIFLFVFIYMGGIRGGVFPLMYEYFPTIKLSRLPGRMGIVLPFIFIMVIAAVARQSRESSAARSIALSSLKGGSILFIALCAFAYGTMLTPLEISPTSPQGLNPGSWTPLVHTVWLLGGTILGILTFCISPNMIADFGKRWWPSIHCVFIFGIAFTQTFYLLRYGSWTRVKGADPTFEEYLNANHLPLFSHYPFIASSVEGNGYGAATKPAASFYALGNASNTQKCLLPVHEDFEVISHNMYLPFYLSNEIRCRPNWAEGFQTVGGDLCTDTGAVIALDASPACRIGINQSRRGVAELLRLNRKNKITELTPNSFEISVRTGVGSVLVTPFPKVAGWAGEVDGQPVELLEIDGGLIGVSVAPGAHRVRLSYYAPKKIWGYFIVWLSGAALVPGIALCWLKRRGIRLALYSKVLLYGCAVILGYFGYVQWRANFDERATRRLVLHNTYPELLKIQFEKWQAIAKNSKIAPPGK